MTKASIRQLPRACASAASTQPPPASKDCWARRIQAQLEFAVIAGRLLVTHDRDFLRIAAAGSAHHGIAYSPPQALSIGEIVRHLMQLWRENQAEDLMNRVEYL